MRLQRENLRMVGKLGVIAVGMFAFGYALVPLYKAICEVTGINILALSERDVPGAKLKLPANTQVDTSRTVTVEFDANGRGDWQFKPDKRYVTVHPGELAQVVYEIHNTMPRQASGLAIPSYAPMKAGTHFRKLECFCFQQQKFDAAEVRKFPVVFVVDPKLPADVHTITVSYTFFEVAGAIKPGI